MVVKSSKIFLIGLIVWILLQLSRLIALSSFIVSL